MKFRMTLFASRIIIESQPRRDYNAHGDQIKQIHSNKLLQKTHVVYYLYKDGI
jgi:hypothetical protein